MDTVKTSKRFSFAGFSSGLSRSLSFNTTTTTTSKTSPAIQKEVIFNATTVDITTATTPQQKKEQEEAAAEELRKSRRAQKSKSLYIKSFTRKPSATETTTTTTTTEKYDVSEAKQTNSKEIRNSIRRSLSAVLYASPHVTTDDEDNEKRYSNKLVPVLVTPELSESVGGILIDDGTKNKIKEDKKVAEQQQEQEQKKKKKPVEYDNSLEVITTKEDTTIIWQGYGYTITDAEVASEMMDLETRFEKEVWTSYCGLIHPLHLFQEVEDEEVKDNERRGRWTGLTVTELRRYYDNYGSMMLKIREARMLQQQKKYHQGNNAVAAAEWIIPDTVVID